MVRTGGTVYSGHFCKSIDEKRMTQQAACLREWLKTDEFSLSIQCPACNKGQKAQISAYINITITRM